MRAYSKLITSALMVMSLSCGATAETYPVRPIKVVVPFAAAGVQDVVTRIVFEKVSSLLGQAVVIENRPGAGGTIAMAAVAASPADGYTLVVSDPWGSLPAAPSLYRNLTYSPITSFEPIGMVGSSGAVLSVGSGFEARTLTDLIASARAEPGKVSFGSTGNGTPGHLNGERFKRLVGIDVVHVPYRVVSQAVTDLMTARISFWISPVATVLPQLNAGQLRPLAAATETRLPDLPEVPTIKELGYGDFDASTAYAFFAPAGTPAAILEVLTNAVTKALNDESILQKLAKAGVSPRFQSPADVKVAVANRLVEIADLVKTAGIVIDGR